MKSIIQGGHIALSWEMLQVEKKKVLLIKSGNDLLFYNWFIELLEATLSCTVCGKAIAAKLLWNLKSYPQQTACYLHDVTIKVKHFANVDRGGWGWGWGWH